MYANAHVKKIYELDPPTLIQKREQLAKARAGGTEEMIDECERMVQAELHAIAAQVQTDQEPEPEQADARTVRSLFFVHVHAHVYVLFLFPLEFEL